VEKPIIFSGETVRAILDGRKTQTRRIFGYKVSGPNPPNFSTFDVYSGAQWVGAFGRDGKGNATRLVRYQPGDVLCVRENWWEIPEPTARQLRDGADTWPNIAYDADENDITREQNRASGWKLRPSIHLPRKHARIFLSVRDLKIERLQSISDRDAVAEGVRLPTDAVAGVTAAAYFSVLWQSINKQIGRRWCDNPWVVATTFRRLL
jgi:hypothetical protein